MDLYLFNTDHTKLWAYQGLDAIFDRASYYSERGVTVRDTPPAVIRGGCDVVPLSRQFVSRRAAMTPARVAALEACCDPFSRTPFWLITQSYTNQCYSESILGCTDGGNAGVLQAMDCKARMEIRRGVDQSGLDTWRMYPLSAEQYASCCVIFARIKDRLEPDVIAFWTDQGIQDAPQVFWASDMGQVCIEASEGYPGLIRKPGDDDDDYQQFPVWPDYILTPAEIETLRDMCGEAVETLEK